MAGSTTRCEGRVKWFSCTKGFGFLEASDGEGDIFVHYTAIQTDGYRTLSEGERVEFELIDGPKGRQAQNVVPLG